MITNIKLLLLVIVLLIFNASIIEPLTYKWTFESDPGLTPLQACDEATTGLSNQTYCNISEESCRNQDGSFKSDGEICTNNSGIIGECRNVNNRIICNISNDSIENRMIQDITNNPPINVNPEENYYTIKKDGESKTHAPFCSDTCNIDLSDINCLNNENCCLCSTVNWNKVYTSKKNDNLEGNILPFTNLDIFSDIDKSGYSIVELSEPLNGDITIINDNDNFKRYFNIPGSILDDDSEPKKYSPSKGYFFNQFIPEINTEHNFILNEYPNFIQSNDNTYMEDPFYYEECLYQKIGDSCGCLFNNIPMSNPPPSLIFKTENPRCVDCPPGSVVQAGECVGCAVHNKVLSDSGECVDCDNYCSDRNQIKCIYRDGQCYSIDSTDKIIRSDCIYIDDSIDPVNPEDILNQCNVTNYGTKEGENLYHLSSDNTNILSQYYSACLDMDNCEVVQHLIDLNEGYINYNTEDTNNTLDTNSDDVLQYNMVTNVFCKDINNESACKQLKQCDWNYSHNKCLVNINYNKYNVELDNDSNLLYHYIPIPTYNEEINNYLSKECSGRNENDCNINCEWDSSNICIENSNTNDTCSSPTNLVKYYNRTDVGYGNNISESEFNNKTDCKNLTDYDTDNTSNINYNGNVKGFCFNGMDNLYPTGCVDSRVINDIILYKDQSTIDRSIEDAENNLENNITLINHCKELCDINNNICDDYGVKFSTVLDTDDKGCYLVKSVNWECQGTVSSGEYSGLECSSTPPSLEGDTDWCESTDGCSLEYINPLCIDGVDNPPGCILQECTEPNVPYEGCIIPECTDVATPYDGCIVPYCTAPGEPYDECIRTICDENEYVSSTEDGLRCTPCAPGYHNEAGNVIFDGETTCTENLCVCDNGTPSIGIDCPNNGDVKCIEGTCNDGYYFDNNDCLENICVCNNGTAATGINCPNDGDIKCIDGTCNDGYYFDNNDCLIKTCVCNNGTPAIAEQCDINGNTRCIEPCNNGYHLSNNRCLQNVCVCENGVPSIGEDCPNNGEVKCNEGTCDDGYYFTNNNCLIKTCICENGTPATGVECPNNEEVKCLEGTCNSGYYLNDNICEIKECTCEYGTGSIGVMCPSNGSIHCSQCNSGYHLGGASRCLENVCDCPNGTPTTGIGCPNHGSPLCITGTCNTGYHGDTCTENVCNCPNGTPKRGSECPSNGERGCVARTVSNGGQCDGDNDCINYDCDYQNWSSCNNDPDSYARQIGIASACITPMICF